MRAGRLSSFCYQEMKLKSAIEEKQNKIGERKILWVNSLSGVLFPSNAASLGLSSRDTPTSLTLGRLKGRRPQGWGPPGKSYKLVASVPRGCRSEDSRQSGRLGPTEPVPHARLHMSDAVSPTDAGTQQDPPRRGPCLRPRAGPGQSWRLLALPAPRQSGGKDQAYPGRLLLPGSECSRGPAPTQ